MNSKRQLQQKKESARSGVVFDIKRYAIHDGPGIRTTVFFKGCPLRCPWCHNPEGQNSELEIIWYQKKCHRDCVDCVEVCPHQAVTREGKSVLIDQEGCDFCGKCTDVCAYQALEILGWETEAEEVMAVVEKDRVFFDESRGGLTLSGGEPLMQPDFLEAVLDASREKGVHTALDTCGYAPSETVERIGGKVDLFLYDLKLICEEEHKEYTGASNRIILENLKILSGKGKKMIIRVPLIAGVNDGDENIADMADFLLPLKNIKQINLLPYHRGGAEKYKRLKKRGPTYSFQPASGERTDEIKRMLQDYGFSVKIRG